MLHSPVLTIARTDAESGRLLSSNVDPVDHEFILGTTTPGKAVAEIILDAERQGASGSQLDGLEAEWISQNHLVTFDQGELEYRGMVILLMCHLLISGTKGDRSILNS